ncbi:MAG: HEAT repeat domain-containing protein [Phycisphaerales bacterium]|nr:HEAT repeat domain-containing protein [Phycisphaerales bacterium]
MIRIIHPRGRAIVHLALVFLGTCPALAGGGDADCGRAQAAIAADGKPFDAVTGREVRNFPPDPVVNYEHLALDMVFADIMSRSFTCNETLTFTTLTTALERLELDAVNLRIDSVTDYNGKPLSYRYDDKRLLVRFDPPLPPATKASIRIAYECREPETGMFFALPDEPHKSRALSIHTQGESIDNRHWFVCHDHPNVRLTSETFVTVPARYAVVANGKLVEKKDIGDDMIRWHHRMDQPHVPYLVSVIVGDLVCVSEKWREIPVEYWVPPYHKDNALPTFGKTPKMIELFSKLTGFDYPYAKYAQTTVYLFNWGGMENISATTLIDTAVLDSRARIDGDEEGLISHELAHQWFGDVITCKTWAHIWLNEGWATYMSWVWNEHEYGRDRYLEDAWHTMRGVADTDNVNLKGGVVFHHYDRPMDVFGRSSSNPYGKGASVLHMLRMEIGDELFWRCTGEYLKRFAWKTAETDDFRKVFEELSGRSLDRFFYQWFTRGGVPHARVGYEWDDAAKEVRLTFEQTQPVAEATPAFSIEPHVWFIAQDGAITRHQVYCDQKYTRWASRASAEPKMVLVDPECATLARYELNMPIGMHIAAARAAPTAPARLYAIRSIADDDRDDVRETLAAILNDDKSSVSIRSEAAAALGSMQKDAARDILLKALSEDAAIADHKVRNAAIGALGRYRDRRVAETLVRFANKDTTYTVEATATGGLGNQLYSPAIREVLLQNAAKPSHGDSIRETAIRVLAGFEDPAAMDAAMKLAAYGQPDRGRPTGIDALARIARRFDRDKSEDRAKRRAVRELLVALLNDPETRSIDAAIGALGTLGDEEAIGALELVAGSAAPAGRRNAARDAVNRIRAANSDSSVIADMQARIRKLEEAREQADREKISRPDLKE